MVQVHVTFGDNSDSKWKWFGYVAILDEDAEVLLKNDGYDDPRYDEAWNRLCDNCSRQVVGLRLDWFIDDIKKA